MLVLPYLPLPEIKKNEKKRKKQKEVLSESEENNKDVQ